jgi:hypothetical protein
MSLMPDETMCYVARYPGYPGYGFITVDLPDRAKDNAKEIAKAMRKGATIERVTVEQAKAGLLEYLNAKI